MPQGKPHPPEVKARALRYHTRGYSPKQIAELLGVDTTTIRSWTDPEYAANRRAWAKTGRRRKSAGEPSRQAGRRPEPGRLGPEEEAALPPLPKDTRPLTGVLLGDPLPGRSALDRRGIE